MMNASPVLARAMQKSGGLERNLLSRLDLDEKGQGGDAFMAALSGAHEAAEKTVLTEQTTPPLSNEALPPLLDQRLAPVVVFTQPEASQHSDEPALVAEVAAPTLSPSPDGPMPALINTDALDHLPQVNPEASKAKADPSMVQWGRAIAAPAPPSPPQATIVVTEQRTHFAPIASPVAWSPAYNRAVDADPLEKADDLRLLADAPPQRETGRARVRAEAAINPDYHVAPRKPLNLGDGQAQHSPDSPERPMTGPAPAPQAGLNISAFAPVNPAPPALQVASAVIDAQTGDTPQPTAAPTAAAPTPALKVLRIELQPAGLGSVTVTLSLKDQSLAIALEAEHEATAGALRVDTQALADRLSAAGYAVDGLTISVAKPDITASVPMNGESSAQTSTGKQDGGGRDANYRSQSDDDRANQSGLSESHEKTLQNPDLRGGVYL